MDLRLTAEQVALVCQANPDAVLELSGDGRLIPSTATGGETGRRNSLQSVRWRMAPCSAPTQRWCASTVGRS